MTPVPVPGPDDLDVSRPSMARVYDCWLGGHAGFAADQELAAKLAGLDPGITARVWANRKFLAAAVGRAAANGIGQFIDLGSGFIPPAAALPVHIVAREAWPQAKVAYVDSDLLVAVWLRALTAQDPGIAAVEADLSDPGAVLGYEGLDAVIDPGRPVCVLFGAVLHYWPPEEAQAIVAGYAGLLAPGSWIVASVSHFEDDDLPRRVWGPVTDGRFRSYTAADLAMVLSGLKLVSPGIAGPRRWAAGIAGFPAGSAYMLTGAGVTPLARCREPRAEERTRPVDNPDIIDVTRPALARVHDFLLGGHDNFDVDRDLAARLLEVCPEFRAALGDGRAFSGRAVTWAALQGISQFLDLGAGFQHAPMLHDTARAAMPDSRVVYVDTDQIVFSHTDVLHAAPGVAAVRADLTDPAAVLADETVRSVIDLREPVCVLFGLVLAFLDTDRAREAVAGYVRQLVPGSVVAVSVPSSSDPGLWEKLRAGFTPALFSDHSPVMLYNHPAADVASFLDGMELVQPGVVMARGWRGGWPDARLAPAGPVYALAGTARTR